MIIVPPDFKIGYKGHLCDQIKNVILSLKTEMYKDFINEINMYKNYCAHIYCHDDTTKGFILDVDLDHIVLCGENQKSVKINLDHVQYVQFEIN